LHVPGVLVQPRGRFGVFRGELENLVRGWRPDAPEQRVDHADLVTDAAEGVPRTEEVICPYQGVPLIV